MSVRQREKEREREKRSRQFETTRETFPTIEPTYTAQTIIINSPNCNIKYVHQGNIRFQTIEKRDRKNKSLLQIPVETKVREGERERERERGERSDYTNWVSNKNLMDMEAKERHKRREDEPRSLDQRRRNSSQTKYDMKFTMRALESIYSDQKMEQKKGDTSTLKMNSSNFNIKEMKSARRKRFVSPKENTALSRNESPYMLTTADKLNSTKTLSLNKFKSTTPFRANKYFRNSEGQSENTKTKEEEIRFLGQESLNEINDNIESVWSSYGHNELPVQIKTKLDIESYISSVRIPLTTFSNPPDETFSPQSKKDLLEYDFQFEEEKREVYEERKHSNPHRRNVYVNGNSKHSAGKPGG